MSKQLIKNAQPLAEFIWPVRIYIEDTDAGGIVFYVNYLKYMERARTECLRALGFAKAGIMDDEAMFVVHSLQVDYKAPAKLDELITVEAHIMQARHSSVIFRQNVWRDKELLCSANVKIACVNRNTLKPMAMPEALQLSLKEYIQS